MVMYARGEMRKIEVVIFASSSTLKAEEKNMKGKIAMKKSVSNFILNFLSNI